MYSFSGWTHGVWRDAMSRPPRAYVSTLESFCEVFLTGTLLIQRETCSSHGLFHSDTYTENTVLLLTLSFDVLSFDAKCERLTDSLPDSMTPFLVLISSTQDR